MAKSLRRQKILLERELRRLVVEGIYLQDVINPDNYRLKTFDPKPEVSQNNIPKVREYLSGVKSFKGFPNKTEEYYDASLKSDKTLKEFSDDYWRE